jgi:hypothetical protein
MVLDMDMLAGIADDRNRLMGECPRESEPTFVLPQVTKLSWHIPVRESESLVFVVLRIPEGEPFF